MTHLPTYLQHLLYVAYTTPLFLALAAFTALLLKRHKSKSHRALMFVFLSAAVIHGVFVRHCFFRFPDVATVLHYPNLLVGTACMPVIIIYFMSLLRPGWVTARRVAGYLAPSAFYLAVTLVLLLTNLYPKTYYTREAFVKELLTVGNVVRLTLLTTYLSHLACHGYIIVRALGKHRRSLRHKYSYTQGIQLGWAYWALLAAGVFALLPLSMVLFEVMQPWMLALHGVVATVAVSILFFAGYHQPVLYSDGDTEGYREEEHRRDASLPLDNRQRLKRDIVALFEEQKLYRNTELSVDEVANDLNTNRTYVSRVINEEFGMNFYAFVNKYRLAEFMSLLLQSEHPTTFKIRDVSEQVGFKSYSSFFGYFKEQTGYTPSEYIRRM